MRATLPRFLLRWRSSSASKVVSYVKTTTEELTGQSLVAAAQSRVREKKNELITWRQRVSDATARYEDVQHKLRHVYVMKTQLYQAQRRDLAALQAINTEEENLLTEEQSLIQTLESLKQAERECFEALGDSILSSHEEERAQSERMKYYSRLGSVVGAVVGFVGSNMFLRREVRRHHQQQRERMSTLEKTLGELTLQQVPHSDDIADGVRGFDQTLMQALEEEREKQSQLLEGIQEDLASLRRRGDSGSRAGRAMVPDQTTIVVTGLGIFGLSYVMCCVGLALSR